MGQYIKHSLILAAIIWYASTPKDPTWDDLSYALWGSAILVYAVMFLASFAFVKACRWVYRRVVS